MVQHGKTNPFSTQISSWAPPPVPELKHANEDDEIESFHPRTQIWYGVTVLQRHEDDEDADG